MNFEKINSVAEAEYEPKKLERSPDFAKDAKFVIDRFDKTRPRIPERSFVGFYPKEEVDKNIAEAAALEIEFEKREKDAIAKGFSNAKEIHQLATAMEVIVAQPLTWWGEGKTTRTSKYDDYHNDVDAVLELPGEQHIGFALDFTTSNSRKVIKDKIDDATKHVLVPGKPAEVKYYISPVTKKQERITVIPIIIGLDGKDAKELVRLTASVIRLRDQAPNNPTAKGRSTKEFETLKRHPAQMVFILEINSQLARYHRLLENATDPRLIAMRSRIGNMIEFIHKLGETKAKDGIWTDDLEEDEVFRSIREITAE